MSLLPICRKVFERALFSNLFSFNNMSWKITLENNNPDLNLVTLV